MKVYYGKITRRERQIIWLISEEHTNQEIANLLHICVGTVETHRKNIFRKLDTKNMAGMITKAFNKGILKVNVENIHSAIPEVNFNLS